MSDEMRKTLGILTLTLYNKFYGDNNMTRLTRPYNLKGIDVIHWYRDHKATIASSDCWLYQHPETFDKWHLPSYVRPLVRYNKEVKLLSRLTYELHTNQKIPERMQIGHTCEATSPNHLLCFNPDHLVLVTSSENAMMKTIVGCEKHKALLRKRQKEAHNRGVMPRFTNHIDRINWILENNTEENENGCLVCICGLAHDGYAHRSLSFFNSVIDGQSPADSKNGKKTVMLHRYIKFVLEGIDYIKTGRDVVVHHTCVNRACINPDHLEITTQSENLKASLSYRRNIKLNETAVHQIYTHWLRDKDNYRFKKDFCKKYAEKFEVLPRCIYGIINKLSWVYFTDAIDQEYSMGIKKIS